MIGVIDAGLGNIGSVLRIIERAGGEARRIERPAELRSCDKLILPGVGHFDHGMRALSRCGMVDPLKARVLVEGTPVLGICLGMQLLLSASEEGDLPGLGIVEGLVRRFNDTKHPGLKVPHMGWNSVHVVRPNALVPEEPNPVQRFYFVHSFFVVPNDPAAVVATASHGDTFCAVLQASHVMGTQFHPEKSHQFGIALMKRFVET